MQPEHHPDYSPEDFLTAFSNLMSQLRAVRNVTDWREPSAPIAPPRVPRDHACLALLAATTELFQLRSDGAKRAYQFYRDSRFADAAQASLQVAEEIHGAVRGLHELCGQYLAAPAVPASRQVTASSAFATAILQAITITATPESPLDLRATVQQVVRTLVSLAAQIAQHFGEASKHLERCQTPDRRSLDKLKKIAEMSTSVAATISLRIYSPERIPDIYRATTWNRTRSVMCEWLPSLSLEALEQDIRARFITATQSSSPFTHASPNRYDQSEAYRSALLVIGVLANARTSKELDEADRVLLYRAERVIGDVLTSDLTRKIENGGGFHEQYAEALLEPLRSAEELQANTITSEAELRARIALVATLTTLKERLAAVIGQHPPALRDTRGRIARECQTLEEHSRSLESAAVRAALETTIADLRSRGLQ